jgi:hypothetical protein
MPDFVTEKTILIMSGGWSQQDRGSVGFNPGNGTITVLPAFGGQILAGTLFRILNISTVELDVLTILARIGDPSGDILTSLTDKWGDIARSLTLILGTRWDLAGDLGTDIAAILSSLFSNLSTFGQETAPATAVNGTTWKDLLDKSVLTKPTKICGFVATVAGGWAGKAKVRITDGSGTKIFPFQAEYVQDTDFTSGVQVVFNFPVEVPVASGYKFQFRSTAAGDGAGKTLQLNNLDVIAVG